MKIRISLQISSIICITGIIFTAFDTSDEDSRYVRIREALRKSTFSYHQQKVYLHLDRNAYYGGEELWFKAYVVNGTDHLPDTSVTNLYVELFGPEGSRVFIKRLQLFSGFGAGDFHLPDTLAEGSYQIRAYTAWMQNFNHDYYFKKNLQLINPRYKKYISPKQARMNSSEIKKQAKDTLDVDLQFMPEGGSLVERLESVVAFKSVNRQGKGVNLEGSVYDDQGKLITTFKSRHKGIGKFIFTPEPGVRYFAVTQFGKKEIRIPLPKALESGIVMRIENLPDRIIARFVSNQPASKDPTANELIIVGQVGGIIYYYKIIRLENGKGEVEITRDTFPAGILQLTAFSGRGMPLTERLVFMTAKGIMKIDLSASDSATDDGTKVVLRIKTHDTDQTPLFANLSLSVTRHVDVPFDPNEDNIVSNMLISSDLIGTVEDPLEYIRGGRIANPELLDNLMLTQGWRRFVWNDILAGKYPVIQYPEEKGITVSGRITREFFDRPLKNAVVELSILTEYNDVFVTNTDEEGRFLFDNMVYFDTVSAKLEARRQTSGRKNLVIQLQDDISNDMVRYQDVPVLTTESERDNRAYRIERNEKFKDAVKESEKAKRENSTGVKSIYGEPDYVLNSKDFHTTTGNIFDVIRGRVPGVQVNGNSVEIRGPKTFYGYNQPLYVVDGIPLQDSKIVEDMPIEDIERVEFLKGPSAAIYGSRGANGVIAIYTKRGVGGVKGMIEFDMLGYSAPRQFYQPKYEINQEPAHDYTLLWIPVIITNSKGMATVVFDKPKTQGDFHFAVQGLSYYGHPGYADAIIGNQ